MEVIALLHSRCRTIMIALQSGIYSVLLQFCIQNNLPRDATSLVDASQTVLVTNPKESFRLTAANLEDDQ